ncbi:MAG: hypothetical protein OXG81_00430 [Acidobacteria bacterium]|nr:hypothetical protein [Acidobacteriota bacterium]
MRRCAVRGADGGPGTGAGPRREFLIKVAGLRPAAVLFGLRRSAATPGADLLVRLPPKAAR